ncbi:MAG: NosD domain-containing protein [Candidatus Odinarchaeota archaeon]
MNSIETQDRQDGNLKRLLPGNKDTYYRLALVVVLVTGMIQLSQYWAVTGSVGVSNQSYSEEHDPVSISSDVELVNTARSGSGTANDPYILGGWNISSPGYDVPGITVHGTTSHFIIRDCWIQGDYAGIAISQAAAGTATVVNNTCRYITIDDSSHTTVVSNTLIPVLSYYGGNVEISNSAHTIAFNNTCTNILISSSNGTTVANNTCQLSIGITDSTSVTVVNNTCDRVYIDYSPDSTVKNNIFHGNGLTVKSDSVEDLLSLTVVNNSVNGLPVGYLTDLSATTVNEPYSQLILVNCIDMTVKDQNCSNVAAGIAIYYSPRCWLLNNTCSNNHDGIAINAGSDHATVVNNTCQDNWKYGISIDSSDHTTVVNNTCDDISLGNSPGSAVVNNICNGNGIRIDNSANNSIKDNTYQNSSYIIITGSASATVVNNTRGQMIISHSPGSKVKNNVIQGISISYSPDLTAENNIFLEYGLSVSGESVDELLSLTVVNNSINGLPVGYLTGLSSTAVNEPYSQLILVNCTDVTVKDQNCSNAATGIAIYYSPRCRLLNNTCQDNWEDGISIDSSDHTTVVNNTCQDNGRVNFVDGPYGHGISVSQSSGSTVINNTCQDNRAGGITVGSSDHATVANNTCQDSYYSGITVGSSDHATVANNTCQDSYYSGITVGSSDHATVANNTCSNNGVGIFISASDHATVVSNTCNDNSRDRNYCNGIRIRDSVAATVTSNTCNNNTVGISIESFSMNRNASFILVTWNVITGNQQGLIITVGSDNCTIHHNYFINNMQQAFDDGMDNQWYDNNTDVGNYWSNYNYLGSYLIPGRAEATDPFPIIDFDWDGLPDWWENQNGFDFTDPSDALKDPDGDGVSNLAEYRGGSDPRDIWSVPFLSFSLVHLLVLVLVGLTVIAAIAVQRMLRARLVSWLKAPDLGTAVKVRKSGFKDYPAYQQALDDVNGYLEDGNAAFKARNLEVACQQYGIALSLAARLGDEQLVAEAVFITASVLKEQGTLTAESPVLKHFPVSDRGDPVITALRAMLQALLAGN